MLEVRHVDKSFGDLHVLDRVDLDVAPGQIKALLGPNGAGKTTLLSIVAGLLRADAGSVRIAGHDIASDRNAAIANIAIAPQETGVQQILTARDNLEFAAALAGLPKARARSNVNEVIDVLGIGSFADKQCSELSGGQQRRVHTGCALVADKPLLLLDEPTVGADIAMRAQLLAVTKDVAARGTAVVYTTHYLPEVEALGADVAVIENGDVLFDDSLTSMLASFAEAVVELRFASPPSELAVSVDGLTIVVEGDVVRATGPGAVERLPKLLNELGSSAAQLQNVEILPANLDSAYLQLTGRRFAADGGAETTPSSS